MVMTIPLDDLLPTSDGAFQPVDSGQFFEAGSSFWEFSDMFKWQSKQGHDPWRFGYMAAMFEAALKSGRKFYFPVRGLPWSEFVSRAREYGRVAMITEGDYLIVRGHDERVSDGRVY